uniref:PDZ domain-containing protein n=1 Tax=Glossina austeni TaxID=7395 RepID=A0A1A9VVV9_GLOAU
MLLVNLARFLHFTFLLPLCLSMVEAGDVILKVNGTDVHRYTTKEVLKCLRLSDDLVTLELKRDPKLKARIKEQLAQTKSPHYIETESHNNYDYHSSSPIHSAEAAKRSSPILQQYEQTHNYQTNSPSATPAPVAASSSTTTSPASRYRSPSNTTVSTAASSANLPQRHQINTSTSANHSRSSSTSSAKFQLVDATPACYATTAVSHTATSPTGRPSRIPQAVKCPQKPNSAQHSPQHKRPRPSQIPTKAGIGGACVAANTVASNINGNTSQLGLQHSNSYSGSNSRLQRTQLSEEKDSEPISAPPQPTKAPRFEAYMMTGDLILNLSRTPQSSNLLPAHAKKVDSLRDSPNRPTAVRPNGALAPKASGESSPTSSSSVDSPTHTASTDSGNKCRLRKSAQMQANHQQQQQQQQQQRDSFNNSYNNRKDSLTNDTLLMCEELERDDEDRQGGEQEVGHQILQQRRQKQYHQQKQRYRHQQQQMQQKQRSYDYYQNEDEADENAEYYERQPPEYGDEENEEDQTNYDITNLETYNSGGGGGADDEASDRQCLMQYGDDDDDDDVDHEDEDYSNNSLGSASTKQRLNALKQKAALRYKARTHQDAVDCARNPRSSGSSSSSATVGGVISAGGAGGGGGGGGANTSQDETSFSVPTSPISLSTPLIDKETANSVPTSPEPSNLVGGAVGVDCNSTGVVIRRHNGIVRKCDSAGFRTSKSEDHLQQIQREGMAAVIPIDIDEDVNSSLNTLLDTRQDSEDSQVS